MAYPKFLDVLLRRPSVVTLKEKTAAGRLLGFSSARPDTRAKREGLDTEEPTVIFEHAHAPAIVYTHVPKCHKTQTEIRQKDPPTVLIFSKEDRATKNTKIESFFLDYFSVASADV